MWEADATKKKKGKVERRKEGWSQVIVRLGTQADGFRFNTIDNRQLPQAPEEKRHTVIVKPSSRKIGISNKIALKVHCYINSIVVSISLKLYKVYCRVINEHNYNYTVLLCPPETSHRK